MRRILRKIAGGETHDLGDTTTLAEPEVIKNLVDNKLTLISNINSRFIHNECCLIGCVILPKVLENTWQYEAHPRYCFFTELIIILKLSLSLSKMNAHP